MRQLQRSGRPKIPRRQTHTHTEAHTLAHTHARVLPAACVVLALQLAAFELEELLGIKLRFPCFRHVMWQAALHYAKNLHAAAGVPLSALVMAPHRTMNAR